MCVGGCVCCGQIHGEQFGDRLYQPATKAGDVVFFSEASTHGTLPWTASHERRAVIYRFAPSNMAYGRGYAPEYVASFELCTALRWSTEADAVLYAVCSMRACACGARWPEEMYQGITDAQRAVLEPPYNNRLDRPYLEPSTVSDAVEVQSQGRSEVKKEFDQAVFGKKYF